MQKSLFIYRAILILFLISFGFYPLQGNNLHTPDSTFSPQDHLSKLLKGNKHVQKAMVLNRLYAPRVLSSLKSGAGSLELDSIVVYEWIEEIQKIEKSQLYTCTFEEGGKTVLVDILNWDINENKWVKGSHNYYWFNTEGKLEEAEFQEYVSPEYRLYIRFEYVYEDGRIKTESKYDRIDEIETWSKVEQLEYLYNSDSTLRTLNINEWDTWQNAWLPVFYHVYNYDDSKNLSNELAYQYDYLENKSTKKFERTYRSDSIGNVLEIIELVPGWENDNFVPDKKQENTFSSKSLLESESHFKYDYDLDNWLGKEKWYYDHSPASGVLYQVTAYNWNSNASTWEYRLQHDYNSQKAYESSQVENWEFLETYMPVFAFGGIVCDRIERFIPQGETWELNAYTSYHFSDQLVAVEDAFMSSVTVYPNPFDNELVVDTKNNSQASCIIRNLHGQVLFRKEVQGREILHMGTLNPGFYTIELFNQKERFYSGKIIKR